MTSQIETSPDLSSRAVGAVDSQSWLTLRNARVATALASRSAGQASRGMTLIEIMVVIVIIGVLGSAMAYGVFGMLGDAREDSAKAQVATVGQVVEAHEAKHGSYPDSLQELTEGKKAKLKVANLKDPWKQDLQYSQSGEGFSLCSNGADKKSGTDDDVCYGAK